MPAGLTSSTNGRRGLVTKPLPPRAPLRDTTNIRTTQDLNDALQGCYNLDQRAGYAALSDIWNAPGARAKTKKAKK